MTEESEVYFEITVVGPSAKISAVDAASAIEVAVIAPARMPVADMKKLALAKLKAQIARAGRGGAS